MSKLVPVIMGSKSDDGSEHNQKLYKALEKYGLPFERRVASAHKHPEYLLRILQDDKSLG